MVRRGLSSGSFHGYQGGLMRTFALLIGFLGIAVEALAIPWSKMTPKTLSFGARRSGEHRYIGIRPTCHAEANANDADADATAGSYDPNANGDDGDTTENEAQAMKDMETLIVSLSVESDDTIRRARVAALFDEKLKEGSSGNSNDEMSFENLFNRVLIVVGEEVRLHASLLAPVPSDSKLPLIKTNKQSNAEITEELPSFPLQSQQKSKTDLQLWALVDMMVQSRTLIRKAAGR